MQKLNRELQLKILRRCEAEYPGAYVMDRFDPEEGSKEFRAQAAYLHDEGLIRGELMSPHHGGIGANHLVHFTITPEGIRYLEHGDALTPVTAKLWQDTIRDLRELIAAAIETSPFEPAQKTRLRKALNKAGDATLTEIAQLLAGVALDKRPEGVALLLRLLPRAGT